MNDIILKSGMLRGVSVQKNGDLKVAFLFKGKVDAGYTLADRLLLEELWDENMELDLTIGEASDVTSPNPSLDA